MKRLESVAGAQLRDDLPDFKPGDTVRVHVRVVEGEKERIQVFEGIVIRLRGSRQGRTFTVRKVSGGIGVERVFPINSPMIKTIEVSRRGRVRRAKLHYLRDRVGKKARVQEKRVVAGGAAAPVVPGETEKPDAATDAESNAND